MLLPMLIKAVVSLVEPPASPPEPPRPAPRDIVLFTEADGWRTHLPLDGERPHCGPAILTEVGQVAGGLEWGPAYVVVDAAIPEVMSPEVALGLRLHF